MIPWSILPLSHIGTYRHSMNCSGVRFKKLPAQLDQSCFLRLHFSALIFIRLFRLGNWTWCLSETSMPYSPTFRVVSWEHDETTKAHIHPILSATILLDYANTRNRGILRVPQEQFNGWKNEKSWERSSGTTPCLKSDCACGILACLSLEKSNNATAKQGWIKNYYSVLPLNL